jgi:transglutaminase-like putative cysteine protease
VSTPPLLLGAALLFWGWQTGLLPLAAGLALLLEGSRLVGRRWELARADFNRVSDLCTIVLLGMVVYLFSIATGAPQTSEAWRGFTVILQWLPLALAPLMIAQAYSAAGRIELSAFFWSLRKEAAGIPIGTIDLGYPYLALCLLSAGRANTRTLWFYVGVCVLSAWALWGVRSRRFSPLVWGGLLAAVAVAGYGGHVGLHALQTTLEAKAFEWFVDLLQTDRDPYRTSTQIGYIGDLKLSDRILLRVTPGAGLRPPLLLRDASYNLYNAATWLANGAAFEAVQPEPDGITWKLEPGAPSERRLTVSAYLKRRKGMLALPNGATDLDRLTVVGLSRNRLGAVRVEEGPGLVTYTAAFGPASSLDGPPTETDLRVPAADAPLLAGLATDVGLRARPPAEIVETVARFFRDNFRYSTYRRERSGESSPLADFLLRSHAGHCEYFATATVLLLRAAGVPARYATGYSVQEWSRLESAYVVRARHAHSWTLVYLDGAWRDLDTTPAIWADVEGEATGSIWEPISDLWSRVTFLFSRWRWGEGGGLQRYIGWLLIPLIAALAWRLYSRSRAARVVVRARRAAGLARPHPGDDSEFYAIERALAEAGLPRHAWEPASSWIERAGITGVAPAPADPLREIVALHYRYRFDPAGISAGEREALRSSAQAWLDAYRATPPAPPPSASPTASGGRGSSPQDPPR